MNELLFPPIDQQPKPVAEPSCGFVCFMLAQQRYGVEVSQVREVLRLGELAWVPGAPAACLVFFNLRGQIVSVLDLRQLLGQPRMQPDEACRLLVIDYQDAALALLVDRVLELSTVAKRLIEATPRVNNDAVPIDGVVSGPNGPLFLLEPAQLLTQLRSAV